MTFAGETSQRSSGPLRIGLIGTGRIGHVHASAVATCGGQVKLTFVADREKEPALALAYRHGAEVADPEDLASRLPIDAAIVATPPDTHERYVLPLLDRGVAVLCEKPIAATIEGARRIVRSGRIPGRMLAVSSKFCFTEGVVAAGTALRSGRLGRPRALEMSFCRREDLTRSWRVDPTIGGGGILMDRGPQALDIVRALLGEPKEVRARKQTNSKYAVEDEVELDFRTDPPASVHCRLSWRSTDETGVYASVQTERATIEFRWDSTRLHMGDAGWRMLAPGYDQRRAFVAQFQAFLENVNRRTEFPVSIDHSLANAEAIAAIYASNFGARSTVAVSAGDDHAMSVCKVRQMRSMTDSLSVTDDGR